VDFLVKQVQIYLVQKQHSHYLEQLQQQLNQDLEALVHNLLEEVYLEMQLHHR